MTAAVWRAPAGTTAVLSICSAYALLAVLVGKDVNWDLLNYHLYNGYAFAHGRLDVDLAPGQLETFLNPLLDVPLYFAITHLPPVLVGASSGFVQGLNGVAMWLLGRELLPGPTGPKRDWAAFGIGLVSGLGSAAIGELGGCMGDGIAGIFVLFSMVLLLRFRCRLKAGTAGSAATLAALAGALAGIGPGLKLTALLYVVALGVGSLVLIASGRRRALVFLCFGAGAATTWLLVSGYWLWEMWTRFQSPLFPFFNNVFRSDWAPVDVVRETRFLPRSLVEWLFYPLVWSFDHHVVSEHPFRDGRLPLAYLITLFLVGRSIVRRVTGKIPAFSLPTGPIPFFAVTCWTAYVLWLAMFSVYRYLGSIDWLTTLGLVLLLWEVLPERRRTAAIATCFGFLVLGTKPHFYGRAGWSGPYFDLAIPELPSSPERMMLIADNEPMGFLIPYFPPDIRFVRLRGRPLGGARTDRFDGLVHEMVHTHRGALYVLYPGPDIDSDSREILGSLGLRKAGDTCKNLGLGRPTPPPFAVLRPNYRTRDLVPPLHVCALERVGS
jgi:hypothetical protein